MSEEECVNDVKETIWEGMREGMTQYHQDIMKMGDEVLAKTLADA